MTEMQSTDTTRRLCIPYIDRPVLEHIYTHLNPNLCDVVFVVNGEKFPTHSIILGGASDFFTSMVQDHFKETASKEIPLNSKYTKAFAAVLEYMYGITIQISALTIEEIAEMLDLATKFNLPKLREHIAGYLSNYTDVTLDCAVLLINIARQYQLGPLTERVKSFLYDESKNLLVHESFVQIQDKIVIELLESDHFYTKEIDILHAALKWIDANVSESFLNSTKPQLHSPSVSSSGALSQNTNDNHSDQNQTIMYRNEISSCQIIEIENSKIQNNTEKLSDEDVEPVYGICKDQSEKSPTTSSPKLDGSLFSPPSIIDSCDKATFYWLAGGGTIDGTEKKSETNQSVMDIEEDKNKDSCPIVLEESFDTNLHKETIAMKICNEDKKNEDMRSNIRRELETSDQAEKSLLLSKALLRTIRFSDISMDDFFKVIKSDLFVKYSDLISMSARKSKSRKYPRRGDCHGVITLTVEDVNRKGCGYEEKSETISLGNGHKFWIEVQQIENCNALEILPKMAHEKETNCTTKRLSMTLIAKDKFGKDYYVTRDNFLEKYFDEIESKNGSGNTEDRSDSNHNKTTDCEINSGDIEDDEEEGNSNEESNDQNSDESDESESNSEYNSDESIQETELDLLVEDAKNENDCEGNSGDIEDEKEGNSNEESSEQNSDESDESNSEYNSDESDESNSEYNSDESDESNSEYNSDESDESNSEYNSDESESIQEAERDLLVEDAKNLNYCEGQSQGTRLSHDILFSNQFIREDDSYTLEFHVEFRCYCERTGRKSA